MNDEKPIYRQLCENEPTIPLFMQAWWWDIVCEKGHWNVCLAYDNDQQIVGALLYYKIKLKGIISAIIMPALTPYAGIWIKYKDAHKVKLHTKYTIEKKILTDLVEKLPNVSFFQQFYEPHLTDWQPFYWAGYRQITYYTYLLPDISDLQAIYQNLKGSVRTDIKKAEKIVTVNTTDDIDLFYKVNRLSFVRQGIEPYYSFALLKKIDAELKKRQQRRIYLAEDASGNIHAAIYIVWDKQTAHYLIGGADSKLRQSGAVSLLIWQAIQDASKLVQSFDFQGSMFAQIEPIFRSFGAIQTPFFRIYKRKNKFYDALAQFFEHYK